MRSSCLSLRAEAAGSEPRLKTGVGDSAEDIIALISLVMWAVQARSSERVQKPMNESYCPIIQICVLITSRMVDSLETTSSLDRPWYLRDRRFVGCSFWATVWNLAEGLCYCAHLGFVFFIPGIHLGWPKHTFRDPLIHPGQQRTTTFSCSAYPLGQNVWH